MTQQIAHHLRLIDEHAASPPSNLSDDALMLLSAHGNHNAFSKLLSNNEVSIRRYCFGMLGSRPLAEEAAQDTFLKLWETRKRYRPRNQFRAYLFSIARNQCISLLRRRKILSFVGMESMPPVSHDIVPCDDTVEVVERDAILHAAISGLPIKMRSALILRFIEEMSYEEISQVTGRTPSAVRSRVHYGLKVLAEVLPKEVRTWND